MLCVPSVEGSTCLPYIFMKTCLALQLIDSTIAIYVIQNQTAIKGDQQNKKNNTDNPKKNWAILTYSHTHTHTHTKNHKTSKTVKHKLVFKTTNTIRNILNTQPKPNIYHNSGIYQLQCQTCFRKYIGQTGRTFHTRYTEHVQDIQTNRGNTRLS
jgi:hypothetical protein